MLVGGLVAICLIGAAFAAAENRRQEEIEQMRIRSERVLDAIGVTVAVFVAENDMAGLDTLIAHVSEPGRYPDLREISVLDAETRVLAHSQPERFNQLASDDFSRSAVVHDGVVWTCDGKLLKVAVPAVSGLRWATVTASYSLERLEAAVAASRTRWLLMSLGLAATLALALFLGLDRLVVRPLRSLQQAARRMGEGDLKSRVPPLRTHELGELSGAFNRMASALQHERDNLEHTVSERTRELKQANERLERLAVTDGLTGIFNHRRFQEALAQEVLRSTRSSRPVSVLMADVDHFKRFNDTNGHPAGDELLRRLASVLAAELRATDLLARYGGEEFAVVLPDTGKAEALQAAERLRSAVDRQLNAEGEHTRRVSISVGVATFGTDGDGPQALLAAADRALYVAKNRGRNQVVAASLEVG